jgi:endonuclease YncB( thermonuclease family)
MRLTINHNGGNKKMESFELFKTIMLSLGIMFGTVSAPHAAEKLPDQWQGKVSYVHDGDTITVSRGKDAVRVRLYGVDCPESGQPGGAEAADFTKKWIAQNAATVNVYPVDRDQYGRIVAQVRNGCGCRVLNLDLVTYGQAWVFSDFCSDKGFCNVAKQREKSARKHHLGVWKNDNPTAPWEWRREHKHK